MEEDAADYKAKIFYYFRDKHYNTMLGTCKDGLSKFRSDISFHLFHALALMLNNRIEESVNELESIKLENDVKLATIIALMYTHRMLGVSSKELFQKLDSQMRELRKSADSLDFYHAGVVLYILDKPDKALDYLEKASVQGLSLKGWILLHFKKSKSVSEMFEHALSENKRNLDAVIGLSESFMYLGNLNEALATINQAIVRFSHSSLPLVQKMKVLFAAQDWDQAIETMNRVINAFPEDFSTIKTNIVILLCRDANYSEALPCIDRYISDIEEKEPNNAVLLLESAQLFSKICGRHEEVLQKTQKMVERAAQIHPDKAEYIIELGYQCFLAGRIKDSLKYYKAATKLNEASLQALMGLTLCELLENGKSDQAKKQIDYLLELEGASNSALMHLIRAKIANPDEALNHLKKACDIQLGSVKHYPYSEAYLLILDPDFMLDLSKEYLQYQVASSLVQSVLQTTIKACPGLYEALYLLAKLQYFTGDNASAMQNLDQILSKIDDTSSEAHLLMAQIQVQSGLYDRASQSLENGLSNNFKVRENPLYHYIRGLVEKNTGNLQDAIKSFTTSLSLTSPLSLTKFKDGLSLTEKASIYIEMIDVHNIIGQVDEAAKLLEDAIDAFQGTPEEARILILSADHALKRRNVQTAVDLLSKVKPSESYYLQAKTKLAEVFLKYQSDKHAYLQCYQEMVNDNPGAETYILLGDAYMNILEPDDALECYKNALQQNPKDPFLTSKMGKAYVETHYFAKAVTFYKDSIKLINDPDLKLQLAELHLNLKQYPKAEVLLITEIEAERATNLEDLTYLQHKSKLLMLLAQIQEKSGNQSGALSTLKDARDNQNRVRRRLTVEQANVPQSEIKLLLDIGVKLAEISISLKSNEQAVQYYKDALEISPNNTEILVALARLYMQMNLLEPCQQICANILRLDAEDETASVMMADLAFRKIDFDMALFHFTQLIVKQPTNWTALIRLVEIMRRTGNLDDFPDYLANAKQCCGNSAKEPGFLYCTAMYQWYTGNLNGALRNFNGARQDADWGQQALCNMIEICLNPDDEMFGDQFIDNDDSEYRDSRSMALKTADRLLKELKQRMESHGDDMSKYRLLVNFRLLASQDKHNIERGLEDFINLASQCKDQIGPILGMSTAYTMLKQSQRAKNQLKRVAKTAWTFEDAEYLERCWLLLSDYYIQSTKLDVASELLSRVVQHNKSCSKAYEYLGFIAEKEQHYKDAVGNYENAWKFGGKSNPGIGYKLAYNLMKCKSYADAIDVGQQVLKLSPDYPKIKKDVLDKSMNNLRI